MHFLTSIRSGEQTTLPVPPGWGGIASLVRADIYFFSEMCLFYCFPLMEFASVSQIMWFWNLKATYLCGGENEWFSLCNLALPSLFPFPHIPMCYGASCSRNSLGMKCHRLKVVSHTFWRGGGGREYEILRRGRVSPGEYREIFKTTDSLMMELRGFE